MEKNPLPAGSRMGGQKVFWNKKDLDQWKQAVLTKSKTNKGNNNEE